MNRLALICFNAFLLLAINGGYLWPHAEPSIFYISNLVLHLALGLVLTGIALGYLLISFKKIIPVARWALVCFLVSSIPALALLFLGNTQPHLWILHSHIFCPRRPTPGFSRKCPKSFFGPKTVKIKCRSDLTIGTIGAC